MILIENVVSILLSLHFAASLVNLFLVFMYRRRARIIKEDAAIVNALAESLQQAELIGSIKQRFKQFQQLTEAQQELFRQADIPSAGSSHSKFKNSVISEIRSLEEKKRDILKTILADGIDAPVRMIDGDGTMTSMRISEVLAKDFDKDTKTDPIPDRKPVRNLRLIKGEKDDKSSDSKIY